MRETTSHIMVSVEPTVPRPGGVVLLSYQCHLLGLRLTVGQTEVLLVHVVSWAEAFECGPSLSVDSLGGGEVKQM